jgi:hypothetical protein
MRKQVFNAIRRVRTVRTFPLLCCSGILERHDRKGDKQMKARNRNLLNLATAALFALTAIEAQPGPNSGQSPEGAWSVTINFAGGPTCASAPAVFTREGTVIADSCVQNLATGYGSWIRTGNRLFAITFIGNVYGAEGAVVGSYKVRAAGPLDRSGDSFSGPFVTQFFDLTGAVTLTTTGTVTARRIHVEPL